MPYVFNEDKSRVDFDSAFNTSYAAKYQLLWSNQNPLQDFAQTTITFPSTVSLSDYKFIDIITRQGQVCRVHCADNDRDVSGVMIQQVNIEIGFGVYLTTRDVYIDIYNNEIEIGDGTIFIVTSPSQAPNVVNYYLVPIKIYGVKL